MSGFLGNLSPQQEEALKQFKEIATDIQSKPNDSDQYYLSWLRAKSFDVEKAVDMFQTHIEWRKQNCVDELATWDPPEVLTKYFPGGFFGEDKEGFPVYYEFIGNLDFKGLAKSVQPEDVIKTKILQGEKETKVLEQFSKMKGRCVEEVTVICNLENLSYQRHFHWPSIRVAQQIFKMHAENYPGRSKCVLVINAPSIFPIAFNIIKTFLDENTKKRIVILGEDWKEKLQEYIAADQLPQAYGGTRCEPDPQCSAHINWGGDVPKKYFLSNLMKTKKDSMERTVVKRSSTFMLELEVELPGTAISWEFITTDHDIGFGVYKKPNELKNTELSVTDMTVLIPSERFNCHVSPQTGVLRCDHSGQYVLRFDNTYSWARSKELFYSICVLPPDTELCQQNSELEKELVYNSACSEDNSIEPASEKNS